MFDLTLKGLRLLPVAFGSRRTVGNEVYFHLFPGESTAALWGMMKNRFFLWGRTFTLITDCRALLRLMKYSGSNYAVRRLLLEISGYWFTIVNRPARMLMDADFFSCLGEDMNINPLLTEYMSYSQKLKKQNRPSDGDITKDNMPGRRKTGQSKDLDVSLINVETDVNFFEHMESNQESTHTPIVFENKTDIQSTYIRSHSYIAQTADD